MDFKTDIKLEVIDYLIAKFAVESGVKVNNIKGYEIIVGNMKVFVSDIKQDLEENSEEEYIVDMFDEIEEDFKEILDNITEKTNRFKELLDMTVGKMSDIVKELEFEVLEINKDINMLNDLKLEVFEFTNNNTGSLGLLSNEFVSFNGSVSEKIQDEKKILFEKKINKEYNHDAANLKYKEFKATDYTLILP